MTIDHAVAALTFEERLALSDAITRAFTLGLSVHTGPVDNGKGKTRIALTVTKSGAAVGRHFVDLDNLPALSEAIEDLVKKTTP